MVLEFAQSWHLFLIWFFAFLGCLEEENIFDYVDLFDE